MKILPIKLFSSILCFIIIFQILLLPHQSIEADAARWSSEKIPADGQLGKWGLALGSDLQYLTIAPDGSLYCYATPTGTTDTFFKSIDNGVSWSTTGRVKDMIIDIAVCPQDSNTIYYATASKVCKSTDAGISFTALPLNPGGSGAGNVQITSIDVIRTSTGNIVALSTRDMDAGQFGGAYLLDESVSPLAWIDTGIGNYDVLRVAFSPIYPSNKTLITVNSNEVDTIISGKIDGSDWRAIISDATITGALPASAVVSFPDDYGSTNSFFIGISTGTAHGDVFKATQAALPALSTVTDLDAGLVDSLSSVDISSLCIAGRTAGGSIIAGCAGNAKTYMSHDGGISWVSSQKPPTGQAQTCVVVASGFLSQQRAFTVTTGLESAFSVSLDGGLTWNQTSLIDSKISTIVDVAVTPATLSFSRLFMITFNNSNLKHSVWRRTDATSLWQRIFCGNLTSNNAINYLICPPVNNSQIIYLAGESDGSPVIWQSNDSGQNFLSRPAPFAITSFVLADGITLYIGGFAGGKGVIYRSSDGGVSFPDTAEAGTRSIISLSLSPSFVQDKTIIAGNNNGQVFWSNNGGVSFEQVGQQLPLAAGVGKVSLAFDRNYNTNKTIYAATDAKVTTASKERIFRFVIGQSNQWQNLYGGLPENASITRLLFSNQGIFYALNSQAIASVDDAGGMLRTLSINDPSFENVRGGLDDTITLYGLWTNGTQFWSVNTKTNLLMSFSDYSFLAVMPASPPNHTMGIESGVKLDWLTVEGATEYEWQLCDHASFSNILSGFSGTSAATSTSVVDLKPGTTYYWRVCATKPFRSFWSEAQSFTTILGGTGAGPKLDQPGNGTTTGIRPIFRWGTVNGADRYELVVSTDANFTINVINLTGSSALTANAWQCDQDLNYDCAYFWKVRACNATNASPWSDVNAFLTGSRPLPPVTPVTTTTPIIVEIPTQAPLVIPTPQVNYFAPENPTPVYSPTTIVEFNLPKWAIISILGVNGIIVFLLVIVILVVWKDRRH